MPPKKKGTKKKVGKKSGSTKGPTIIDGVPVSEMSKDQLEGHVRRLQDELHREREERNYYQLERDRLSTFWQVGKKQLEECRAEARVKDRDLEEAEERHQTEVKVYKQKVKHLLYEQEHNLAELKAENMISLKVSREEHAKIEQLHLDDKRQLQEQLHAKDKQLQQLVRNLKLRQSEDLEKLRQAFEDRVKEIEKRYSDRFQTLRSELHLRLKSEVSETEERKNMQIESVKRRNEKSVTDMKNYYNDITLNNLAMISTLKEEIKAKDDKLERQEQTLGQVQQENKRLAEPLKRAREQLADLQRQLGSQEQEKSALVSARAKLKDSQRQNDSLKWELDVLRQKYERTLGERDEIHEKFSSSILEMQQKSSLKYLVLEKKITTMKQELDVKDAQLHTVLSSVSATEDDGDGDGDEEDEGRQRRRRGPRGAAAMATATASAPQRDRQRLLQLQQTRNVVRDQEHRIQRLEGELLMMRQRRQWGDDDDDDGGSTAGSRHGSSVTSSSTSSSSSSSPPQSRLHGSD